MTPLIKWSCQKIKPESNQAQSTTTAQKIIGYRGQNQNVGNSRQMTLCLQEVNGQEN